MRSNLLPMVELGQNWDVSDRLRGWTAGDGALHARLSAALKQAIERGDILPGTRLPPERSLAKALSVGRSTVAAAYASLAKQGFVSRRQGSGTWVEPVGDMARSRAGELATRAHHKLFTVNSFERRKGAISFLAATPDGVEAIADFADAAAAEMQRALADHHGYWPLGYPPLRQAIAKRMTERGLKTAEADVLITTGAQQAIALTAWAFVAPGDFAVLEDPTYPGAIDAYRQFGARILSVPVGSSGLDLALLRQVLSRTETKLIYATPSFQNPTGAVMPEAERRQLAELADFYGAHLVEDEAHAEIDFGDPAPPPAAAYAANDRVITVGTFSKTFWGGLRVGWIRAAQPALSHLARLKAILDLSSPLPTQVLAALVLARADELIAARNRDMQSRASVMAESLRNRLPDWSFDEPGGGLVVWAKLPHGSASEFAEFARAEGVLILPGSMTSASGSFDDHVRIPFVAEPEVIERGVTRLARAWRNYCDRAGLADRQLSVSG